MKYTTLYKLMMLHFLVLCQVAVFGQAKEADKVVFNGTVKGENSKPLVGVTIELQETKVATITGKDGKFKIKAALNEVLIVKAPGYLTINYELDKFGELNVILTKALTDAGEEDDVVIPFGIRKKRQITTAISSLHASNFPELPLSAVTNVLTGRIPGLYIQQSGASPGNDNATLQVRARSTFGPGAIRILVDGVQREFGDLDPNEIESVTVLKDAASLAWYGIRSASGVLMITTKKGNSNRSNIHLEVQNGAQFPQKIIKPLNSYDFARLYNESAMNDGSVPIYDSATLNAYQNGTDPLRYPNNNYINDFIKKSSSVQRYVLSADGGSNTVRYFVLMSYYNQNGLFNNTKTADYNSNIGFNRFNFRGNVDFDVNENLRVSLNAGGRSENRRQPGSAETGSLLSLLYNTPPNAFPLLNSDGSYGGNSQFQNNPLGLIRDRGYTSGIDRVLMATLDIRQKLDFWVKGLSANINYSYDVQGTYTSGLTKEYEVKDMSGSTPVTFRNKTPLGYRSAAFGASNRKNEAWAGFDYDRTFGRHTINASLRGQSYVSASPERLAFKGEGISGRVDYSLKQRYYVGFVASYSGSENFAADKRYGFFPAVSAGWVVSDESFLKNSRLLNYFKIRTSYGEAGSSDIGGSRFPFESFFSRNATSGGYSFGTGFSGTNSATEVQLANPDITWETMSTVNIGTDLKFFNHSLSLSVDVFKNNRTNIITQTSIPGILGQTLVENAGSVDSKGIEAALDYFKRIGNVTLSFNGNILLSEDKITAENGQKGLPAYQSTIGKIVGANLVFISDGLFKDQMEINNSPKQVLAGKVVPGDIKYKDIGGVLGVPDGIIDNLDRVRINKRDMPNTYYGFGTLIKYKAFDFSTQFQGVMGRTIDIQGLINSGPFALNEESLYRWTPVTAATAKYPRLGIADKANNTSASDFWRRSGDYLRLKYVEVGVTIPPTFLNKYHIKDARIYAGGFNLISFDKLDINVDPEIPGAGRGSSYPYLSTFHIGFRTSF